MSKKSTEAEDVLEFLNSLPEDKNGGTKSSNDEEILNFLAEIDEKKGKTGEEAKKEAKTKEVKNETNKETKNETKTKETEKIDKTEKTEKTEKTDKTDKTETETKAESKGSEAAPEPEVLDPITSFSNWWSSSGSAAVNSIWSKTAEQATQLKQKAADEATRIAKENNISIEEAQKRLKNLTQIEKETTKGAINLFTQVFNSIIKTDEILLIKLNHDLEKFDNLHDLILKNFNKVLDQVEGDIKIQIHNESISKNQQNLKLNLFNGKLIDGDKLIRENIENLIKSDASESKEATQEDQDDKQSIIYLSILPINPVNHSESPLIDNNAANSFNFTILLRDTTHNIEIMTRSQSFPLQWAKWIENSKETGEEEAQADQDDEVNPAEWVKSWIDDGLSLSFGLIAQQYVVKRMGYS